MNDWPTNRAQKAAIADIKKARHGVHSEINSKSTQSMLKSTTLIGLEGGGWGARSAREHVLRAALGLLHPPCELIEPIGAMNVKPSEDV